MRALILAGLVLAMPCRAQPAAVAPWMTGAGLLKKLEPVRPQDVPWTPKSGVSREELAALHTNTNIEYARGYVAALHDATEGTAWCFDARHQTPNDEDFWNASRWGLASLPDDQRKRNAARLLPAIWRAKWPCPTSSRGQQ
jgi:hypothetical protein